MDWEIAFLDWIQQTFQCAFLDWFMPLVTKLGDGGVFWILVTLGLFAYKPARKYAHVAAIALILGLCVGNMLLKPMIARIRPFDVNTAVNLLISKPLDYSFPSGHTQASFAAATSIMLWKKRFGIPALIIAVLVALSRMYLYVHYPTDVLGGLMCGVFYAFVGNIIANNFFRGKKDWDGCELKTT